MIHVKRYVGNVPIHLMVSGAVGNYSESYDQLATLNDLYLPHLSLLPWALDLTFLNFEPMDLAAKYWHRVRSVLNSMNIVSCLEVALPRHPSYNRAS